MGKDLEKVVGVESSDKVVGVLCTDVRPGMFSDEVMVNINGTDHSVSRGSLLRIGDQTYVRAIRVQYEKNRILVGINSGGSYENIVIGEEDIEK